MNLNTQLAFDDWMPSPAARRLWTADWCEVLNEFGLDVSPTELLEAPQIDRYFEAMHDSGVLRSISDGVETYEVKFLDYGDRWVYLSALQKAIRFNQPQLAVHYFRALVDNDSAPHAIGRLKVIAQEDIGVGDPLLVAMTMRAVDQKLFLCYPGILNTLVQLLAAAPKSRIGTDIIVPFTYKDRFRNLVAGFNPLSWLAKYDQMVAGDYSIACLMAAQMQFAPATVKDYFTAGTVLDHSAMFGRFYDKLAMPGLLRLLVDQCKGMTVPFYAAWPIVWRGLCHAPIDGLLVTNSLWTGNGDVLLKNDVLAAALDQHTALGKRAMSYALKASKWYGKDLSVLEDMRLEAFGHAVFRVEGADLSPLTVRTAAFDDLYLDTLHECWAVEGWPDPDTAREYYTRLSEDLEALQRARRKIWSD